MPVQKKTSILSRYRTFQLKLEENSFHCHVYEKSRTLHISLLNVNQSLKNPNL